ncbi:unnamed protein product [Linum trigynum]|uniref:RNase H type-1 domain-containing protein n=1 Tax=Linum trigynum TaxID=586398 RepID=A0AAV2FTZ9_9ROSI
MDPIKYIFENPTFAGHLARWQVLLAEFDTVYITRKEIKGSVVADHLAEHAITNPESMIMDFPDENIMTTEEEKESLPHGSWIMKFDIASNALGQRVGAVFMSPEGEIMPITTKHCFTCANNVAEYEACAFGIRAALGMGIKRLKVYGDSALVIFQIRDEWET